MRSQSQNMAKSANSHHLASEDEGIENPDIKLSHLNESIDSFGSKRGRPLIPDSWTWVMKLNIEKIHTYSIGSDLLLGGSNMPDVSR